MKILRVATVWFSPMYHTRELALCLADSLASNLGRTPLESLDLTIRPCGNKVFDETDLLVFAAPTFAGRIPALFLERISGFTGNGAPAVVLVSYGNRAYDNALRELKDGVQNLGFRIVGASACIARHTIADIYAQGRPNAGDLREIEEYGKRLAALVEKGDWLPVKVPGDFPNQPAKVMVLPQSVNENCVKCGICWQNCPAQAIKVNQPAEVDRSLCICCMRCVNVCPERARIADPGFITAITERLAPLCATPKANEFYPD